MKNILTTVAMLLAFSFSAFAQQEEGYSGPSRLRQNHNLFSGGSGDVTNSGIGLKVGVNHARLRGQDSDAIGTLSGHTNFHAGAFAQFSITNFFSIMPEVLYSRRGYKVENNNVNTTYRFNSFDVPVLFAFNIIDNLNIHFGPQIGYIIAAKRNGTEIQSSDYNEFNYGAAAGLEARVSRFRIGARYNMNFNDLREREDGVNLNQNAKFHTVQGYIGFGF